MNNNSTIRAAAREALKGNWGVAIVMYLIYVGITYGTGVIPFVGQGVSIFLGIPLGYSLSIAYLSMVRGQTVNIDNVFDAFRGNNFGNVFTTMLLVGCYTLLWSLLLIVPGLIKGYSYAMTPYILADTGVTNNEAIEESMRMMKGHKMRLFLMDLGFIGLILLSILTLGIALLWVMPYMMTSRAKFYQDLKGE
ncbi:MAG: DUF975 family protein [Rikenellaceae bacterium]